MRGSRAHQVLAFLAILSLASCRGSGGAAGRGLRQRSLVDRDLVRLDDAGEAILARPEWLSMDAAGRYFVSDRSDKNVKVYGPDGRRTLTVGRPGRGPGEFAALLTAQVYGDSLVAYDFEGARLSVFSRDGRFARAITLSRLPFVPFSVRVVDDSLFLAVAAMPGGERRSALALIRPDGTVVSSFFALRRYLGTNPQVLQYVGIMADGAHGVVYAGVAGGDSVWAFDYHGNRLGAAPVDSVQPLVTTRTLVERNAGKARRGDGGWVMDAQRSLMQMVALDSASVAMQVAVFSAKFGVDLLDGGTLVVAALAPGGEIRAIARRDLDGGLLGRSRAGAPLVMRYAGPEQDTYRISELRWAGATSGSRP
jgi:6-bladed beta-propeller